VYELGNAYVAADKKFAPFLRHQQQQSEVGDSGGGNGSGGGNQGGDKKTVYQAGQYGYEAQEISKLQEQLRSANVEEQQALTNRIAALQKIVDRRKEELQYASRLATADASKFNQPLTPGGKKKPYEDVLPSASGNIINNTVKPQGVLQKTNKINRGDLGVVTVPAVVDIGDLKKIAEAAGKKYSAVSGTVNSCLPASWPASTALPIRSG
jgi:hypothetical protein